MLVPFPSPVLSVASDAVRDLDGGEALSGLWTIFTKCKDSLQDGRRLENISWRLWYREVAHARNSTPPSPTLSDALVPVGPLSPVSQDGFHAYDGPHLIPTRASRAPPSSSSNGRAGVSPPEVDHISVSPASSIRPSSVRSKSSSSVGRIIVDMIPENKLVVTPRSPDTRYAVPAPATTTACVLVTPLTAGVLVSAPSTPPSGGNSLNTGLFPRVVVVNPTPHPTPPATPAIPSSTLRQPQMHLLPPPRAPQAPVQRSPSKPTPAPSSDSTARAISKRPHSPPALPLAPPSKLPPSVPANMTASIVPSPTSRGHLIPPVPGIGILPVPAAMSAVQPQPIDETLKAADCRFFLQHAESPSPEQASFGGTSVTTTTTNITTTTDDKSPSEPEPEPELKAEPEQSPEPVSASNEPHPSSVASNVTKDSIASCSRRPTQRSKKTKEAARHVPIRPVMTRFASRNAHPLVQRRAAGAPESKGKAMFNVGSLESSASRKTNSTSPPQKSQPSTSPLPAKPAPAKHATFDRTPAKAPITTAERDALSMPPPPIPQARNSQQSQSSRQAAPQLSSKQQQQQSQQQRRGIVVTHSSDEFETTDEESDDSWASEDMSPEDEQKTAAQKLEEARIREAFLKAEREREMFAKQPKRSYSNLNRTQSGFLSALLNPDPALFPPNHPVRINSSHDIPSRARPPQPMAPIASLSTSKSSAALPVAAQVTAQAPKANGSSISPEVERNGKNNYRLKGRPQGQEMEDDSDSDSDASNPDDKIQVSRSQAQQKLAALAADSSRRRHSDRGAQPPPPERPVLQTVATAPIPLNHPWNLPPAAAPSTPRTTRRQMMSTEISESVRRNLLWERQVNKPQVAGLKRSMTGSVLSGALRPLTSTTNASGSSTQQQQQREGSVDKGKGKPDAQAQQEEEKSERRRRAMARNRSWADDYHYSGW